MKSQSLLAGILLVCIVFASRAGELFVSPGGSHVAPFSDWVTAATNIQSAIDAATTGDIVTVTNGIYAEGGKVKAGTLTNRVAIDKAIVVRSINGPSVTIIQGAWDTFSTNGPGAVRCAWLTNGATLSGFTLRGGATHAGTGLIAVTNCGGGAWSVSRGSVVTNCIITGNAAYVSGGGVFSNTVVNSTIASNVVTGSGSPTGGGSYGAVIKNCAVLGNRILEPLSGSGGGAYRGALTNCTVIGNYARSGSGVSGDSQTPVMNCIMWGNTSSSASATDTNFSAALTVRYSCAGPLAAGTGNIFVDPQLLADTVHLAATSPCRSAGNTSFATGADIDGWLWSNPPSMGCDEWSAEPMIFQQPKILPGREGSLQISLALVTGQEPIAYFWSKDGIELSGGNYAGLNSAKLTINKLQPTDAGVYQVVASNAFGTATSGVVIVKVRCVNVAGVSPTAPYTDWSSSATNIQTAIDASALGDIVLVTNGIYGFGGRVMAGDLTNRIVVDKALIVMSVNGPTATTIEGTPGWGGVNSIGTPNNTNAVRCAWLGDGAVLSGFTLRGGGTRESSTVDLGSGGGAWCATQNALVSYCQIVENSAYYRGGGVYNGTVNNSLISGNGVGWYFNAQFNTGQGGGAYNCTLNNCLIRGNEAGGTVGAAGAGAFGSLLNNCTVIQNRCENGVSSSGAGTHSSQVRNCIVRNNNSLIGASDIVGGSASYTCYGSYSAGSGNIGNITNDPAFLLDGFHLASTSPCRSVGNPAFTSGTDIDGQAWTNLPSMGCDQWLPEPLILDFKMQASDWNQFEFKTLIAGIESSPGYWFKGGVVLSESGHHVGTATTALKVRGIVANDSGSYQLIVSNAFGTATSRVANVIVHFVDPNNLTPSAPFTNWAGASATIQEAVDIAATDAVVVVTNGIYNVGGKVVVGAGSNINRVVIDKPLVVASANGPYQTVIEGQWDPLTTNGLAAVRCALVISNSSLAGFTLRNGATDTNGRGGGVVATSDALIASCIISNNRAYSGGGSDGGNFVNCWFVRNSAVSLGGAAFFASSLNNTTVVENSAGSTWGGVISARATNCVIWFNSAPSAPNVSSSPYYSCSPTASLISGNITNDPQLVDGLHLATTSPCRGAGASILSSATDLDGDVWLVPPSMGCDEFNTASTVGPLAITIQSPANALVNHSVSLVGGLVGRATRVEWNFGDGAVLTNGSYITSHAWTNSGDYQITFTAFNTDNPAGVTGSAMIHIDPILAPTLSQAGFATGTNFQFQFSAQAGASYWAEYATNLSPPVAWFTVKSLTSTGGVEQIVDTKATNSARFYRVRAQ